MKNIFKKGDRVFAYVFGWGTVIYVDNKDDFAIGVEFDTQNNESFTYDGRHYLEDPQILSFTEYKLEGFSQERPEELPKKGDIVWVRNEFPSEWVIGHFLRKKDGKYIVSSDNKNPDGWGDEITTTNPFKK